MRIKLASMIFYGIMKVIFYLVFPLLLISVLQLIGIMQFSDAYILGIIILGVIGTAVTILNHTFKKDTVASGYASIVDSIYSAIFIFYIFGGFTVGDGFGNYFIDMPIGDQRVSIQVGLQIIAYVSMIAAGIKLFQHIFRTAELKKDKEYHVKIKRSFRASTFFRVIGSLVSVALLAYIISIPVSALNVSIDIEGDGFNYVYDLGPDEYNISDGDSITMYLVFNVHNYGIYSILDVRVDVSVLVLDCNNGTDKLIPDNTVIGASPERTYNFYRFTSTTSQNFTIALIPEYMPQLLICNATLILQISLYARYAQLTAALDIDFQQPWTNKTYIPSLP